MEVERFLDELFVCGNFRNGDLSLSEFIYIICRSCKPSDSSKLIVILRDFKSRVNASNAVFWSLLCVAGLVVVVTLMNFKFLHLPTTNSQNRTRFINWHMKLRNIQWSSNLNLCVWKIQARIRCTPLLERCFLVKYLIIFPKIRFF